MDDERKKRLELLNATIPACPFCGAIIFGEAGAVGTLMGHTEDCYFAKIQGYPQCNFIVPANMSAWTNRTKTTKEMEK